MHVSEEVTMKTLPTESSSKVPPRMLTASPQLILGNLDPFSETRLDGGRQAVSPAPSPNHHRLRSDGGSNKGFGSDEGGGRLELVVCLTCGKTMTHKAHLRRHMLIHTDPHRHECPYCPHKTARRDNLAMHIKKKHADAPPEGETLASAKNKNPSPSAVEFICEVCKMSFKKLGLFSQHLKSHHQEPGPPQPTPRVPKTSPAANSDKKSEPLLPLTTSGPLNETKTNGSSHVQISTRESLHRHKFKCPQCPKVFGLQSAYNLHLHKHINKGPEKGSDNSSSGGVLADILEDSQPETIISDGPVEDIDPALFLEGYANGDDSDDEEYKPTLELTYFCRDCNIVFKEKGAMDQHNAIAHTNPNGNGTITLDEDDGTEIETDAGFSCNVCKATFVRISLLQRHLLTHSLKNFKCPFCGHTSRRKDNMRSHIRACHKEIPNALEATILYAFSSSPTSSEVEKVTRRRNPHRRKYACRECGRVFNKLLEFSRHQLIHQSIRPFICEHCSIRFRRRPHLIRHIKNVHKKKFIPSRRGRRRGVEGPAAPSAGEEILPNDGPSSSEQMLIPKEELALSSNILCQSCEQVFICDEHYQAHVQEQHQDLLSQPVDSKVVTDPLMIDSGVESETIVPDDSCSAVSAVENNNDPAVDESPEEELKHYPSPTTATLLLPCLICSTAFATPNELKDHVAEIHPKFYKVLERCDLCGLFCGNSQALLKHLQSEHGKSNLCLNCEKTFDSEHDMGMHYIQGGQCRTCSLFLTSSCQLNVHIKSHSDPEWIT